MGGHMDQGLIPISKPRLQFPPWNTCEVSVATERDLCPNQDSPP
ncbi:hypothetical protein TNCV_1276361, partial [Trichonephila clavipes]